MSGERTRDAPANMATLVLCLVGLLLICRFCTSVVETNVLDLESIVKDEIPLPKHVGTEPGVAMFHKYEDCHITAVTAYGHLKHTLRQNDHIGNFTLRFVAFGKRFLVDLHRTRDLFASSYSRKILHAKGKEFRESLHRKEHCYYQGHIRNNPSSHAALSSCTGFRGYISDGQEMYHIDALNGTLHRIFRNADRKKLNFKCGTERQDVFHPPKRISNQHFRKKRSIRGPYDADKFTRYVELYIVNDYRTFDRHGKDATAVFKRSQDIANIVNSLYRQLNIYIVLVGVEVWSTGDKIGITTSADTTMENFLRYRKERINPFHTNDNAQLITGIFFDHGVVGKAIKGPICTHQFSGGVSMDYDGLVTLVATTMAHEMGHNFGMEHDNDTKCSCPQDKCIMAATSGQFSPQHWSSCSQNSLHEAFELGMDYCLRNPPSIIFDGPVCGNGLVEDGEECDCGLPKDCTNRCCNATYCELYAQAECGTGQCCDLNTCKPKKPASLCRESEGECDFPEYCDGTSEFCPPDVHLQDGLSCSNGQSYCYKGKCNTHNRQCQLLWGNTGRVSDPICFQQLNLRGNHDGNCGYNWTTERYQTCERENVMCGLLHCVHLNEKLMFWRDNLALDMRANFLTRGNTQFVCRSTMLDVGLDMPDPGLVPDGAKCEDNKICIKQTCTPLVKLKIPACPDCHGNGICNSRGNCHCEVGYAPPLCDLPGYGGSIDSGPASDEYANHNLLIGLLVLFLVILPVVTLVILAYINRRRLLSWWELGPRIKFGVLKKPRSPPQPPQPRPSANMSDKRWSSAPTRPNTTLEISGPLLDNPPSYDEYVQGASSVVSAPPPSAPSRPIFKPSGNKPSVIAPKLNPPASRQNIILPPAAAVPAVTIAGKDRRSSHNPSNATSAQHDADGAPGNTLSEVARPSQLVHLNNSAAESTLKRKQREKEAKKADGRPIQSPPTSPTKGGRKIVHSQSLRESQAADEPGGREKSAKRESFRGTEISSPVLVSTTNRDSQVFADFEMDQSGIIARPIGKQHSIHGSKPSDEGARDGCRSPVRRSQSDRPKKQGVDTESDKSSTQPVPSFTPRPLPPEPVEEDEPLYANEGLSDLDDLKAHMLSFSFNPPVTDNNKSVDDKPIVASKPAAPTSGSFKNKSNQDTAVRPSKLTQSKSSDVTKPVQVSDGIPLKPSQIINSRVASLEQALNNPNKKPLGSSSIGTTPSSSISKNSASTGPNKRSSTLSSSAGNKTSSATPLGPTGKKPSTASTHISGSAVRGPAANSAGKNEFNSANSDTKKISTAASKAPSSNVVNRASSFSAANKGSTPGGANKETDAANSSGGGVSANTNVGVKRPGVASKFPAAKVTNKAAASNVSGKEGAPSVAAKDPSAANASKAAGTAGTTSNAAGGSVGNSSNLRRTGSGANRPAVAPKPGAKPGTGKSVRSFNF